MVHTPRIPSRKQLRRAWDDVLAKDRQDGVLAPSIERFAEDAEEKLEALAAALDDGTYVPDDLIEVVIQGDLHDRLLHVPSARDRVVERAVLAAVTPFVDPWLGPASYAYRPGLGVADAIQAVAALRAEGGRFVLRTDVHDCFPSIPVDLALRMLDALVPGDAIGPLVRHLVARAGRGPDGRRRVVRGLAQGCALSPLLANLVLTHVDDALLDAGFSPVRYADDVAVVTDTRADAWEAARIASAALGRLGMELGSDKTDVMSFDEGFCFLGEDFGVRYPPLIEHHRVEPPDRRVLYVGVQGSRVRTGHGRLVVSSGDDADLLDVPTGHVSRVVCFGSVGFSAGARAWALEQSVEVVFASRRGTYQGCLAPGGAPTRADRVRAQVRVTEDPDRTLGVARAIVEAKVVKQVVLLRRYGRRVHAETVLGAARSAETILAMLPQCATVDEVRGMEGAGAREYFPAFGSLFPEGLRFELRSRQPPMDVPNAAISYLYAVLLGECETALRAAGLDPAFGFLHADARKRPSLALDLMEEFRPLVVDQVVLSAARRKALLPEHGRSEAGRAGVLLTKAGREALLAAYEHRMLQSTKGALPDFAGTLRRHLYRQAQRFAAVVSDPELVWTGMSWR